MKVFAYCIEPAVEAVRAATGVEPLTSPPWTAALLSSDALRGHDLLYFRLHGMPSAPLIWWGEGRSGGLVHALLARHLDELEPDGLGGATAVLANCYGAESPMVRELYQAGAAAVITGPGRNWALDSRVVGTDLLVSWVIRAMRRGVGPRRALQVARMRLAAGAWRRANRDAMGFKFMEREV